MKINFSLTMNRIASDTRHNCGSNTGVGIFFGGHLHLCKRAFSALANMKTNYRSRLNVEFDLRVCLSQIIPRIDELRKVKKADPLQ